MLEPLVITLREGIEAALVVGIILAYLYKMGKPDLKKMVYLGLGAAIVASVAFATVLQAMNIDPENEYVEGALFAVAGIMVASLVVWMWRASKKLKAEMERKLGAIVGRENLRAQGWGILALTFFMVFREGAETALFLMGATLGRFDLLSFIGGAIGLGLAMLFAVFFIRGSLRMNLSRFFAATSVVLLILAFKLILSGIHEFAERGAIPLTPEIMAVIGVFVRDNTSTIILMVLLVAPLLVILWDAWSREAIAAVATENAVTRRKRLAARRQESMWRAILVAATLAIVLSTGWVALTSIRLADPQPISVPADNGQVRIPVASLKEGQLAKYVHSLAGADVRFLTVLDADGAIATSLDACQICGPKGYGQDDGDMAICKRCNAPIALDTIGQGGGCNPLPLVSRLENDTIIIPVEELAKSASEFK